VTSLGKNEIKIANDNVKECCASPACPRYIDERAFVKHTFIITQDGVEF